MVPSGLICKFHIFRAFDTAIEDTSLCKTLNFIDSLVKDIVSEILCDHSYVLNEVDLHDKNHKVILIKRIIFIFLSLKGKHLCRTFNKESISMIRHRNTKQIIFKNE